MASSGIFKFSKYDCSKSNIIWGIYELKNLQLYLDDIIKHSGLLFRISKHLNFEFQYKDK